jgi:nucleotide-binding universal stress UspA family protein
VGPVADVQDAPRTGEEIAESESYLDGVAKRLHKCGIYARTHVELAKPEVSIGEVAAQEEAGLIAMATHGRSGLARLVLRSVATGTLQRTSVPLLLVGPAALHFDWRRAAACQRRCDTCLGGCVIRW